ncbi:MAG: sialidase family protein, partial [Actinomycetota bacterium]
VYYCAADVGLASNSGQATCLKSLDGGLTFVRTGEPAFPVAGDEGAVGNDGDPIVECDGLHGHGVADRDGNIYLPKGVCGQPWLAISADEGLTWERMQVAKNGTPTHEAGVAVDPAGNIYYTWIGMDRLPYLAISKNRGKDWSDPIMVGAPGVNEASLPGIAVGETGKVALIYMGSTNSPGEPWTDPYAEVTWNGYMAITADALTKQPVFYTGTVNNPREPLIKGQCGPFRCQAAFDFLDVVIARDGTPWASFVDGCIEENCNASGRFLRLGEAVVGRLVGGPKLR